MKAECRISETQRFSRPPRHRSAKSRLRHVTPALSPVEAEREEGRATALSFALWLKKTSYWNSSDIVILSGGVY
jgi:hypothetical protein